MTLQLIVFIVLALFIAVCSVLAVTTSRILRAATYLLFVLFGTAGIYFQLNYSFLGVSFPFSIPENTIIKAEHIKCCHGGNACHYPSHNRIELEAGSQNFVFREKT